VLADFSIRAWSGAAWVVASIGSGGTLPVVNGGTNSAAALTNNRVMRSAAGAIVEAAAITAASALISDASGIPVASATTAAELAFVSGVGSAIQTQINGKQASGNYITALTGDVTASGPGSVAGTVAAVGGQTAANVAAGAVLANAATAAATASAIVRRDGAGGFVSTAAVFGAGTLTAGAALEVQSVTKTFLLPRMTTAQRDALAAAPDGSLIYNTTTNKVQARESAAWHDVTGWGS